MLLRPARLALFTTLALGAFGTPAVLAASDSTLVAEVQPASASAPAPGDTGNTARYAHREAHDKQAAEYQGGSVIVVGISGGALVVLLLLLLIL